MNVKKISMNKIESFEHLIIEQTRLLSLSPAEEFESNWSEMAKQALAWFNIDRMILVPNSTLFLESGYTISVSRHEHLRLNVSGYLALDYAAYLKILRQLKTVRIFDGELLKNSQISTLNRLYEEGVRWHCVTCLELFGQRWGSFAFSCFDAKPHGFSEHSLEQLKTVCEIWLCFWQHSTMMQNLNNLNGKCIDDSEKLLKLSKKQRKVLTLLALGNTAKQAAEKLNLSRRTIESHQYRMLLLLELDSKAELIQFAMRNGIN